jgi:hypothetical protein
MPWRNQILDCCNFLRIRLGGKGPDALLLARIQIR